MYLKISKYRRERGHKFVLLFGSGVERAYKSVVIHNTRCNRILCATSAKQQRVKGALVELSS